MEAVVISGGVVRGLGRQQNTLDDGGVIWSFLFVLGVSHNQYNLMSIAEIYPANNRVYCGKKLFSHLSIHFPSYALLRK